MDYIALLIKAHKALLKKVQSNEFGALKDENLEDLYAKLDKQNSENLRLKNQVADLELKLASANRELEKRNATILQLSAKHKN